MRIFCDLKSHSPTARRVFHSVVEHIGNGFCRSVEIEQGFIKRPLIIAGPHKYWVVRSFVLFYSHLTNPGMAEHI